MLRHFLLGKIHRATVTRADLDYVGSITLDPLPHRSRRIHGERESRHLRCD